MTRKSFTLSKAKMARISPDFPLANGVRGGDDQRVLSGIISVIRNGQQWKDASKRHGPHKTLYNRFIRWRKVGDLPIFSPVLQAEDHGRNAS